MSQRITNIRCQKKKKSSCVKPVLAFLFWHFIENHHPLTDVSQKPRKSSNQTSSSENCESWKFPTSISFFPHSPYFSSGLLLTTQAMILFIYFLNYLFIFRIYFLYFTILYWFCHTSTWICHGCTHVPHPEPPSHIPPCTIPLGHPNAPAPSILYHASNLDRHWF